MKRKPMSRGKSKRDFRSKSAVHPRNFQYSVQGVPRGGIRA